MVALQFLAGALLASAVLAAPSNSKIGARLERRREGRQTQPASKITTSATSHNNYTTYTSNWAGAVWESYPSVIVLCCITAWFGILTTAYLS